MLSRRNGVPWYVNYDEAASQAPDKLARFLEHVRSHLPEEDRGRVAISTVHRYKGLEQSAVIVLDAIEGSYPLIHPHWMFLRVFGNNLDRIEEEERRLFYVALTRSRSDLALLTESSTQSLYLVDIHRHISLAHLQWMDLPAVPSLDSPRLEVRVFNAYDVRDQLKDLKYRWDSETKCWRKAVMAEGFSFDTLLEQPWASGSVRIEVYSEQGELLHRR